MTVRTDHFIQQWAKEQRKPKQLPLTTERAIEEWSCDYCGWPWDRGEEYKMTTDGTAYCCRTCAERDNNLPRNEGV